MTAPGRYCLATCYCGHCEHYIELPPLQPRASKTRAEVVALTTENDAEETTE